jgi:hypothetical protein
LAVPPTPPPPPPAFGLIYEARGSYWSAKIGVVEPKLFIHSSSGSDFEKVSVPDPKLDQDPEYIF